MKNLGLVTTKRLTIAGFLIPDHLQQVADITPTMEQLLLDGKIINKNRFINGLENALIALQQLVFGGNTGKLAITVS